MAVIEMIFGAIQDFLAGKPVKRRSKEWRRVRKEHLKKYPRCAITGSKRKRQVHHKKPVHTHPELELEPSNFITLHKTYHLIFGHLGNYRRINPLIEEDAKIWYNKIENKL